MPFIVTWDELNPVDGTAASSIDNEIRNLKVSVAERLIGVFGNFKTATDRINANKICVDAAGLNFRNDTDATTIATLTNAGLFTTLLGRPAVFVGPNNAPGGAGGFVQFTTEIIDNNAFHDNAVNNTRLTVPAGLGGNYFIFAIGSQLMINDTTGNNQLTYKMRKNNTTDFYTTSSMQFRDPSGGLHSSAFVNHPIVIFSVQALVATDYVELNLARGAGANGSDISQNYFGMFKLD